MKLLLLFGAILWPALAWAQGGPLLIQNKLSEIAAQGPAAQSAATRNIGAVSTDGGDASAAVVTPTGGTTARTLAARAADVVNVRDYGAQLNAVQVADTGRITAGSTFYAGGDTSLNGTLTVAGTTALQGVSATTATFTNTVTNNATIGGTHAEGAALAEQLIALAQQQMAAQKPTEQTK
jgi:hypothetical protein